MSFITSSVRDVPIIYDAYLYQYGTSIPPTDVVAVRSVFTLPVACQPSEYSTGLVE